jgi:hypothetical protein
MTTNSMPTFEKVFGSYVKSTVTLKIVVINTGVMHVDVIWQHIKHPEHIHTK